MTYKKKKNKREGGIDRGDEDERIYLEIKGRSIGETKTKGLIWKSKGARSGRTPLEHSNPWLESDGGFEQKHEGDEYWTNSELPFTFKLAREKNQKKITYK